MKVTHIAKNCFLFASSYGKHFSRQILGNPYDSADVLAHLCFENRQVSIRMISALTTKKKKKEGNRPPPKQIICRTVVVTNALKKRLAHHQMKMWEHFLYSIFQPSSQSAFETKLYSSLEIFLTTFQILRNTSFLLLIILPFVELPPSVLLALIMSSCNVYLVLFFITYFWDSLGHPQSVLLI